MSAKLHHSAWMGHQTSCLLLRTLSPLLLSGCASTLAVSELNDRAERALYDSMDRVMVQGVVRRVQQMTAGTVRAQLDAEKPDEDPVAPAADLRSERPLVVIEDSGGRAELWFDPNDNDLVQGFLQGQSIEASCRFERYDTERKITVLDGCRIE